jgi:hypothetical protein
MATFSAKLLGESPGPRLGFESMLGADRGGLVVLSLNGLLEVVKQVRETGVVRKDIPDQCLGIRDRHPIRSDIVEEPDRAAWLAVVLGTRFAKCFDRT